MADDPNNKERLRAVNADHRQVISMTVNAAAAAVGLSRATLYKAMSAGQLQSVLVAGRRLIFVDDLVAFIKGEPQTGPKLPRENIQ